MTANDAQRYHKLQMAWLRRKLRDASFSGPTVVVTHHAPHISSLAPMHDEEWLSASFVNNLPRYFFDEPVLWIHGHTHHRFDYRVGNCRVICNPRGCVSRNSTMPVEGFDPGLVVEVPSKPRSISWRDFR